MPSWYLKAGIQGVLSLLPQSQRWNYIFQRNISKGLRLKDRYFEGKLSTCNQHLDHYRNYAEHPAADTIPAQVLELGSGWLPIVPIGLYLSGVNQIISVDINPLLRDELVTETLQHFLKYAGEGRLAQHLPHLKEDRLASLEAALNAVPPQGGKAALEQIGLITKIQDARQIQLSGVDLVVSNSTLEHIPGDIIEAIFRQFCGVLRPGGIMSHLIDLSDHYSHFDKKLTPYNFLQYGGSKWRLFNNQLQYQNRLRVSDYRAIHQRAGWQILHETSQPTQTSQIDQVHLAPEFRHYSREDLIVIESWMVSRCVSADSSLNT